MKRIYKSFQKGSTDQGAFVALSHAPVDSLFVQGVLHFLTHERKVSYSFFSYYLDTILEKIIKK